MAIALAATLSVAAASAVQELPAILSKGDQETYRAIFAAQEKGAWNTADQLIEKIENPILMGYVLEQRYMHPTKYRSRYTELHRWLQRYADHPDAARIYRLARKRQPVGIQPKRPQGRKWRTRDKEELHPDLEADYAKNGRDARRIERRIRTLTADGKATIALNYLNDPRQFNRLTRAQTDRARGWIAAAYYYENQLGKARQIAGQALRRSSDSAVLSHWVMGLVSWRQGDTGTAYKHWSAQADIPYQEDDMRAAAAFWAARAATHLGDGASTLAHLDQAAAYPFTFYGQLSLEQLGQGSNVDWSAPSLTSADVKRLVAKNAKVARAVALAETGRTAKADVELTWAQGELPSDQDRALIALARALHLPTAQMTLAAYADPTKMEIAGSAGSHFPVPNYAPNGGFKVDQAIIFGLIRQESKFQTRAVSEAGARGLMQLMPRTASYIAGGHTPSGRLFDASYNMQLGQSYVDQLLTRYNDGRSDLFEMALSYNWGPGNFNRWRARVEIDDPLLMIESVPNAEARHFVETVLTNMWVYRDRFGQPSPSRASAAAGAGAIYQSLD